MALPTITSFTPNTTIKSSEVNDNFTNLRNRDTVGDSSGSSHTTIDAGTSKLVKIKVLRQDNTTNSYKNSSVFLTGQGSMVPSSQISINETVTFGITFDAAPIILVTYAGRDTGGTTTWGSNTTVPSAKVHGFYHSPATTSFEVFLGTGDHTNFGDGGDTYFYAWSAVGQLS